MKNKITFEEVLIKVQVIFRDVLEDDDIELTYDINSSDIPEWDSLNHISLVVTIEKEFQIQFIASEIQSFLNVGEMCDAIVLKVNQQS
jgi:acyl carrier protein